MKGRPAFQSLCELETCVIIYIIHLSFRVRSSVFTSSRKPRELVLAGLITVRPVVPLSPAVPFCTKMSARTLGGRTTQ